MRFLISLLLVVPCSAGPMLTFHVVGEAAGSWPAILSTMGLRDAPQDSADVWVLRSGSAGSPAVDAHVDKGGFLIVEGQSPASAAFGFRPNGAMLRVRNIEDSRRPQLGIIWESEAEMPRYDVPREAVIFAKERWTGAPLVAGLRRGNGAVLWVATDPGPRGYERFPFIPHALSDLGLSVPFRGQDLWAFFDSSYRLRADTEFLAKRWRSAGIAALHVAAWHYYEPNPERDRYLDELIRICHQNGIRVYAWLELPHVSEKFWQDHPEWREKTADLVDAHLDWRKLMNLLDPACDAVVKSEIKNLIMRFDWDGVNLAELYYESLEGPGNPSRFTPMNTIVREEYQKREGLDPLVLFREGRDPAKLQKFLEFRVSLTSRMQQDWLSFLGQVRSDKRDLDLVLTHVDDHLDGGMRNAIGADAAAILPALRGLGGTFLIEDPATVWHLGPDRYTELASRYNQLAKEKTRLALDINVVERYQNVYPTKQQAGLELMQLVRASTSQFRRTALYFENSILPMDWTWLAVASAHVKRAERSDGKLTVQADRPVMVEWPGPALVNGRAWPVGSEDAVLLPAGTWEVASGDGPPRPVMDFNGEIISASWEGGEVTLEYESDGRGLAVLGSKPLEASLDGLAWELQRGASSWLVMLPAGRHSLRFEFAKGGLADGSIAGK